MASISSGTDVYVTHPHEGRLMTGHEGYKAVVGAGVGVAGTVLCWAESTDLGTLATQITVLSVAVGGSIFVVGQGLIRVWKLYLDTRLQADLDRADKFSKTFAAQLAEQTRSFAAIKTQLEISEKQRVAMSTQLEHLADENRRLTAGAVQTVTDAVQEAARKSDSSIQRVLNEKQQRASDRHSSTVTIEEDSTVVILPPTPE